MIGFKEFLTEAYLPNPIPVAFRINRILGQLNKKVSKKKGVVKIVNPAELINQGKLFATQAILFQSMSDSVFDDIPEPVIVEYKGDGYILDGHLTIAHDLINKRNTRVYWVK